MIVYFLFYTFRYKLAIIIIIYNDLALKKASKDNSYNFIICFFFGAAFLAGFLALAAFLAAGFLAAFGFLAAAGFLAAFFGCGLFSSLLWFLGSWFFSWFLCLLFLLFFLSQLETSCAFLSSCCCSNKSF